MEVYLLKSAACLLIFFTFYKLVLEQTSLHTTKRFFLLGSLIAALIIPYITFTQTIYVAAVSEQFISELTTFSNQDLTIPEPPTDYILTILWSIYSFGVAIMGFRFIRNLFRIIQKIRKNPLVKKRSIIYVLLQLPVTPHSFFNHIFFTKKAYETNTIPKEVIAHERAHVDQKHSWDIIFIELLCVILWFNPILYFIKNSIKLNHEFLADRTVLGQGAVLSTYQNILLDFSSTSSVPEMAHAINYSSIKKRFTVMKKHTSKRAAWLKCMLILPLAAVLVYGFSTTQIEQKVTSGPKVVFEDQKVQEEYEAWYHATLNEFSDKKATPQQVQQYNKLASFWNKRFEKDPTNRVIPLSELKKLETIYRSMTTDQRNNAQPFPDCGIKQEKNDAIPTARSIEIHINANGTYLVEGVSATKSTLAKVVGRLHQDLTPAIRNHMMNIHIMHPKEPSRAEVQFIFDTLKEYGFYRLVAGNQEVVRGKGNTPMKSESPGALKSKTSWEKEYAKAFNEGAKRNGKLSIVITVNASKIMVNGKTVALDKFADEIDRVTKNWSTTDFINAYHSVRIAATPNSFLKKLDAEFKKTNYYKENGRQSIIPTSPPPPPPPATEAIEAPEAPETIEPTEAIKVIKGVNDGDANIPPPPPPPPAPEDLLDHIIGMAKKGATFYYEGKKVSSDKAIELVKKNRDLNIHSTGIDAKKPVVKISKEPIYLKKKNKTGATNLKNKGQEINTKLSEILSEDPQFYLNDKRISSKKGLDIIQNEKSARFQIIQEKDQNPIVLISHNLEINNDKSLPKVTDRNIVNQVKAMNKQNARFYMNNDQIDFDRALSYVRKNKNASMTTSMYPPVVIIKTE
ncbi:MAG: M56 family metallopeptidase [Bacteroidota bacterium]